MNVRRAPVLVALLVAAARSPVPAQEPAPAPVPERPSATATVWQVRSGDAPVRVLGSVPATLRGPRDQRRDLGGGDHTVCFGVDAAGQPRALAFPVPDGASVQLAATFAPAAAARAIVLDGDGWQQATAGAATIRTTGSADDTDYRVAATVGVDAASTNGGCGLVARWRGPDAFYACWLDVAAREVRLERHLGATPLVLARAPLPQLAAGPCELALQVHGFRLQVSVDDRVVLQIFDGALGRGAPGLAWHGTAPAWRTFSVGAPALPRASIALVQSAAASRAAVHAAATVSPGHWHLLELALDRPHPLVPRDGAGLEPWLLQRAAAPQILCGDVRGSLGSGLGELPLDGTVHTELVWPRLPALALQVAAVRVLLVAADGSAVAEATPAAPVVLR